MPANTKGKRASEPAAAPGRPTLPAWRRRMWCTYQRRKTGATCTYKMRYGKGHNCPGIGDDTNEGDAMQVRCAKSYIAQYLREKPGPRDVDHLAHNLETYAKRIRQADMFRPVDQPPRTRAQRPPHPRAAGRGR